MGWLAESNVVGKWGADELKALDAVPAGTFADAALTLISVFDLINGMGVAKGDMVGNANTVKKFADGAPGKSLQELVKEECAGKSDKEIKKIVGDGKTVTCALLWLVRALYFILKMLEPLMADPSKKLSECVMAGYDVSLKPHHGFIIKGTFTVAVKAAPNRADFMKKLADDESSIKGEIDKVTPDLTKLLASLSATLLEVTKEKAY